MHKTFSVSSWACCSLAEEPFESLAMKKHTWTSWLRRPYTLAHAWDNQRKMWSEVDTQTPAVSAAAAAALPVCAYRSARCGGNSAAWARRSKNWSWLFLVNAGGPDNIRPLLRRWRWSYHSSKVTVISENLESSLQRDHTRPDPVTQPTASSR